MVKNKDIYGDSYRQKWNIRYVLDKLVDNLSF